MGRQPSQKRREDPLDLFGPGRAPAKDTTAGRRKDADPARFAKRVLIGFCVLASVALGLALLLRWTQMRASSSPAVSTSAPPEHDSEPGVELVPLIEPAPKSAFTPRIEVTSGPAVVLTTEAPEVVYVLPFDDPLGCYVGGPLANRQLGRRKGGPALKDGERIIDGLAYQESILAGLGEPLENEEARSVELLSRADYKARWIDIHLTCRVPVQITSHERFNVRLIDLVNRRQIARPHVVPAGRYHLALEQIVSPDEAAMLAVQHRYKDAWQQQRDSIKTLEVRALRRSWTPFGGDEEKIAEIEVSIDFINGHHKTRITDYDRMAGQIVKEEEVGRANDCLWMAKGTRSGGRSYELITEDPDLLGMMTVYLDDCLYYLQKAYLPVHLTFKKPVEIILADRGSSEQVPAEESLIFEAFAASTLPRQLIYDIQEDDSGTRIREMRDEVGDRLHWRVTNSDFRKIDDMWVAFRTQFDDFPGGARPEQQAERAPQGCIHEIQSIRFNRELTPDEFQPNPSPKDRVIDRRHGHSVPAG